MSGIIISCSFVFAQLTKVSEFREACELARVKALHIFGETSKKQQRTQDFPVFSRRRQMINVSTDMHSRKEGHYRSIHLSVCTPSSSFPFMTSHIVWLITFRRNVKRIQQCPQLTHTTISEVSDQKREKMNCKQANRVCTMSQMYMQKRGKESIFLAKFLLVLMLLKARFLSLVIPS